MLLISHLVIAQKMLAFIQPDNVAEYYWGSVAADVRYFAGLPRRSTHVRVEECREWEQKYPELNSFLIGYHLHLLADERDAAGTLFDFIPWRNLRRRLPRKWAAFLLEAAYQERCQWDVTISGNYNLVLEMLGVSLKASETYGSAVKRYILHPSLEMAESMVVDPGIKSVRLQRYLAWARWLERHAGLRHLLLGWIREQEISRRIVKDLWANF